MHEKYDGQLDPLVIDDVFEQMKYDYAKSESQIDAIIDDPDFQRVPQRKVKKTEEEVDDLLFQNLLDPQYKDFRAEATNYYDKRKECFEKAKAAHHRKDYHSAQVYSEEAERWSRKLKEANTRASHMIIDNRKEDLEQYNQVRKFYVDFLRKFQFLYCSLIFTIFT